MRWGKHRALVAALAALSVAAMGPPAARAQQGSASEKIDLQYVGSTAALAAFTPAKALVGGKPFRIMGSAGTLSVGGSDVKFAVRWVASVQRFYSAMDVNGNGMLEADEWTQMALSGMATFTGVQVGDKKYVVRIANMRTTVRNRATNADIIAVFGGYVVAGYYQGRYDNTTICIFDDNLDGTISQDGKDAIMIGRGGAAIPLLKHHQIGSRHCSIEVAADGSSMTVTPTEEPALGIVETSFRRGLKVLALVDDQGHSYDLVASGKTGIPAGRYKLSYGVLMSGSSFAIIKPTDKCPVYDIQADKINTLLIGAPLWVSFMAGVSNGNITVSPSVRIYGAAYEEYVFDFSGGTGRPRVLMLEGDTLVEPAHDMEYG